MRLLCFPFCFYINSISQQRHLWVTERSYSCGESALYLHIKPPIGELNIGMTPVEMDLSLPGDPDFSQSKFF